MKLLKGPPWRSIAIAIQFPCNQPDPSHRTVQRTRMAAVAPGHLPTTLLFVWPVSMPGSKKTPSAFTAAYKCCFYEARFHQISVLLQLLFCAHDNVGDDTQACARSMRVSRSVYSKFPSRNQRPKWGEGRRGKMGWGGGQQAGVVFVQKPNTPPKRGTRKKGG